MTPILGKYKFNTKAIFSVNTEFNSLGNPLKKISYSFKKGDIINVTQFLFDDRLNEYGATISVIKEQKQTAPISILEKVPDNLKIDKPTIKKKTLSGELEYIFSQGETTQRMQQENTSNKVFSTKNIIIGVSIIIVTVILLKVFKVF